MPWTEGGSPVVSEVRAVAVVVGATEVIGPPLAEARVGAALENLVGGLQASGAGFRAVGGSFRIAQSERGHTAAMFSPEFEERVAAD